MKKAIYLASFLGVFLLLLSSCDKERLVNESELPSDARTYIALHFPDLEITQVIKERDDLVTSYEVYLSGGFKLDFNSSGEIRGIEGTGKLPDSVVPEAILAYVNTHYPDYFIRDWEWDDREQEVKLSNQVELRFDRSGNFLRIDY